MSGRTSVTVYVTITSPRPGDDRTVGPNRGVWVNVEARAEITEQRPINGGNGVGNGNRPLPLQHDFDPRLLKGPLPQNTVVRDVTSVTVQLGNGERVHASKSGNGRWTGRTNSVERSGTTEVKAVAIYAGPPDFLNFQGSASHDIRVKVDDTPPIVTINQPQGEVFEVEGREKIIPVSGTASDSDSDVSRVRVGVGRANQQAANDSGDWSRWSHTLTLVGIGTHEIRARAVDEVGNVGIDEVEVITIDGGVPVLDIASPRDGTAFNWLEDDELIIEVTGEASDEETGVKVVQWRLDNSGDFVDAQNSGTNWSEWTARVPIPSPGKHTIYVRCLDNADDNGADEPNEDADAITIFADDNPPNVVILEPSSPHWVDWEEGGVSVTVRGTLEDAVAKAAQVEWSVNDSEFEPAKPENSGDWSEWSFDVHFDRPIDYSVKARTRHASGRTSEAQELTVRVTEPQ